MNLKNIVRKMLGGTVIIKGYIRHSDLEGGFEYLEGDDGEKYDISNYLENLPLADTCVIVEGKIKDDIVSFRMFGQPLEIKKLTSVIPNEK